MINKQAIETAPKDGTEILVSDGVRWDLVRWEYYTGETERGAWFCVARGETCFGGDEQVLVITAPVCWMPLPSSTEGKL